MAGSYARGGSWMLTKSNEKNGERTFSCVTLIAAPRWFRGCSNPTVTPKSTPQGPSEMDEFGFVFVLEVGTAADVTNKKWPMCPFSAEPT